MVRRSDVVLEEILEAITLVEDAVAGLDRDGFAEATFIQRGIERSLEIISEAVRHLPNDLLALRPDIPWSDIRSIGNLIRHEYWRVDPDLLWAVVNDDLPPLRHAVETLLAARR